MEIPPVQCHACRFENLPGLTACARCGSPLLLGEALFEPPRANRLNAATRVRRGWHRVRAATPDVTPLARLFTGLQTASIPWRAVAWSIIPGLGQISLGAKGIGRALLGAWLALLLLALLTFGTSAAPWCLYLAVSVHSTALLLMFGDNLIQQRLLVRLLFGGAVFAGLYYALYRPAESAANQCVGTLSLNMIAPGGALANEDVLLIGGPWFRPDKFERGALVSYVIPPGYAHGYAVTAGLGVDRIIGVAGDTVTVTNGVVTVNGRIPAADGQPLAALPAALNATWRLNYGEYVVFPSQLTLQFGHGPQIAELLNSVLKPLCLVRHDDIVGRVLCRLRPWSRFGRVE